MYLSSSKSTNSLNAPAPQHSNYVPGGTNKYTRNRRTRALASCRTTSARCDGQAPSTNAACLFLHSMSISCFLNTPAKFQI